MKCKYCNEEYVKEKRYKWQRVYFSFCDRHKNTVIYYGLDNYDDYFAIVGKKYLLEIGNGPRIDIFELKDSDTYSRIAEIDNIDINITNPDKDIDKLVKTLLVFS